ncbi:MAG: hypothetical protein ACJKSS_01095 [Patescibacteria group bacterium UBA2103]
MCESDVPKMLDCVRDAREASVRTSQSSLELAALFAGAGNAFVHMREVGKERRQVALKTAVPWCVPLQIESSIGSFNYTT